MTYENMYKLLSYLKKNNITLKPEYLRELSKHEKLTKDIATIVKLDEELLEIYFENQMDHDIGLLLIVASEKN